MVQYLPLTYYTYNIQNYYASIVASILFFIFYSILFVALKYEVYNKQDYCDPMFYYGKACRNDIANKIQQNEDLLKVKKKFYSNVKTLTDASGATTQDKANIELAGQTVNANLSENKEFTKNTIEQIQEITNVLNMASSKYLGNLQSLLSSTQNQSNSALQQIQGLLNNVQDQIKQTVIDPALARYTDPLQKLYKSLSDIKPAGM